MSHRLTDFFGDLDHFAPNMNHAIRVLLTHHYRSHPGTWRPPTDVYETDDAVIVKVELAGMNPEDIAVSFAGQALDIHGCRCGPCEKVSYHRMEIPYGEFATRVLLPGSIDRDAITARYVQGFLLVMIPKAQSSEHEQAGD